MSLSIRFSLPDRPGALATVTRALAGAGADILAVHVLDREEGRALDEVRLRWPATRDVYPLIAALGLCPGVTVEAYRRNPWPLDGRPDLDLLRHALDAPDRVAMTLVDMAPAVLDADWAVLWSPVAGREPLYRSAKAPARVVVPDNFPARALATAVHTMEYAVLPLAPLRSALLVGRECGPRFSRVELAYAERVLGLALDVAGRVDLVADSGAALAVASA